MAFAGPCTVLGGLPLWAECWASGPDYQGEYDSGVTSLHWLTSKGAKGKEITQKMYDKIEAHDQFWQALVTEQVGDYNAYTDSDEAHGKISVA